MEAATAPSAEEFEALKAALASMRNERDEARAEVAVAKAERSEDQALIAHLKLMIAKLKRETFGVSSERSSRLLDQMELQLEELEASATEDELAAEKAARATTTVRAFARKKPSRQPFPEHLPRERVVLETPTACACCGGERLSKLGEDITETLEVIPRQWKVIQTVREKFSCRDCETIAQAPAPFHVLPRGWAGPSLLAMIMFEKFGQHQPLNRQAERYAREGVPLSLSTLADQVGGVASVLAPLYQRIEAHVLAAERLHGDDTTVPVLAKGKTDIARLWTYVRDDAPFGATSPPAAIFHYSRDRRGMHPQTHLQTWCGVLQADAYGGYNELYKEGRPPGPILEAACWAHGRRKFFELADLEAAQRKKARGEKPRAVYPKALEAVRLIDALFAIERTINGASPAERLAVRQTQSAPIVAELKEWLAAAREPLTGSHGIVKAINYLQKRWPSFTLFLEDGRVCLSNNAAERALRGIALGRKSWLFCGSDRGGQRAATMYSLIATAKMNDVDPQAWLADVLARINDLPSNRLDELLPWNWTSSSVVALP
ncbi:IS66 family transposase [Brevundimonas vancanneytii]|uniref:IS66 family transposase n=1 Tax=Brevundimonas vancanneytii TaxID=1325724 RepID=UPI0025E992C2|nr:IS66 family transposase [uncultured Brevundimonas sp.]